MPAPSFPCVDKPPAWPIPEKAWPQIDGKPACFIAQIELPKQHSVDLGPLNGARLSLLKGSVPVTIKGMALKEARYFVMEQRAKSKDFQTHILFQGADHGCAYSTQSEHDRVAAQPRKDPTANFKDPEWVKQFEFSGDIMGVLMSALKIDGACDELEKRLYDEYQKAGAPRNRKDWIKQRILPEFRSLKTRPRWVEDEGAWPTYFGRQMLFVGQIAVPDTEVAEENLCADEMLYVFAGWNRNHAEFKILCQDSASQTAEEHYLAEELMALYSQSLDNPKTISRCLKEGDAYVHSFILDQPKVSQKMLKDLATKGANKQIREEAGKRLKPAK